MIAMVWLGMAQGFGLFYRHAGAVSAQGATGRIFGAGVLAPCFAPLLIRGLTLWAGFDAQALVLLMAGFTYLLALAMSVMLPAHQMTTDTPMRAPQGWTVAVGASLVAALAWAVMSAVMAYAPLAMAGCGLSFDRSVLMMALHLMAMYAPGFVIGRLISQFGGAGVGLAGFAILAMAAWALPQQSAALPIGMVMVLAGCGWGIATIGATAWLHQTGRPSALVLALHDLMLFFGAMAGVWTLRFV
jgi:hypothetical protein